MGQEGKDTIEEKFPNLIHCAGVQEECVQGACPEDPRQGCSLHQVAPRG